MTEAKLRTLPFGHLVLLRNALDEAVASLPEIERTSSVKACLAEKLLTLAAAGEVEAVRLSDGALDSLKEACASCHGCGGVNPPSRQRSPSFQRDLSPHPMHNGRRLWN